jgi:NAD+--asparagine ADP-ribosyltransferase
VDVKDHWVCHRFASHDEFAKNIEEVFKKAQVDCGKIQKIFNKYDVKMMNANKLYGKFASYKKQLLKNKSKVTSKLKKFRKDLPKSKHKNKDKIEMELTKLEKILKFYHKYPFGLQTIKLENRQLSEVIWLMLLPPEMVLQHF